MKKQRSIWKSHLKNAGLAVAMDLYQDMEEGSPYQNNSNMHLLESLAVSIIFQNCF